MKKAQIGIIGGSGLYDLDQLKNSEEIIVHTPFGTPSDPIVLGDMDGVSVAFLPRHGKGHRLLPSSVPYQANIYALKLLGVKYLLSISAVGSLRENIKPLDIVLPDQYLDFTKSRKTTFFTEGAVAHISMANPVCHQLSELVKRAINDVLQDKPTQLHHTGTYICIEGPHFSSKAESEYYRFIGADIIGMTNMPEAKLSLEAQIAYCSVTFVTDYDCWHPKEKNVNVTIAIENLQKNIFNAKEIIRLAIKNINNSQPSSPAHTILNHSLVTPLAHMSDSNRAMIEVLLS
ncbi:MAG: methylthioadenosine phosphorylase [Ferrovum sp. 37-45-19]|jgi:5'-methylthioadenosine phosphorylase|uniref:S-methyl-5'-thioadenosine phosphorylase n=1 Tax=Ferrovum sp. JA12 TaxID=1356299 RepID=UPI0007034051|nr:S-methyl-5'-thioadenosine phosphorylase [Ferrovum sp. JA12]OYV79427.1 MAG: methylthioadenosine phosphorylase [Ferrovum sp. 21-44-67]OYV94994.1 MAG: methylthioadenosine phosphorylase [Ferrovum sp. 37-45-19]OZB34238.1 MAG: methylthioadenosine phosphorylase [Ferrovum sp. 34-44-207]HQT80951.1 S-methyl-5'-thioadenosine phosphorylase [Ferrovaceae bacterium]KRH78793.1 S-methyl-5'-thioadenosine phosphorylase [Ferrovum sp. JA12]